jgi:hypothetical protein
MADFPSEVAGWLSISDDLPSCTAQRRVSCIFSPALTDPAAAGQRLHVNCSNNAIYETSLGGTIIMLEAKPQSPHRSTFTDMRIAFALSAQRMLANPSIA